jgi:hypothetical protein
MYLQEEDHLSQHEDHLAQHEDHLGQQEDLFLRDKLLAVFSYITAVKCQVSFYNMQL